MEHRFRFRQGEFELELAGERDFVEAQIARWVQNGSLPAAAAAGLTVSPASEPFPRVAADFAPKSSVTFADFVAQKEAHAPDDLVTVAGYYLEKYHRQDAFSVAELRSVLETLPAWECHEVAEPLELSVTKGFVEGLRDGRYTITYKGQNYVRDGLT